MPEKYWDTGKNELKAVDLRKDFDALSAFKAEQDIRKNSLPATADKYEIKLPPDFKPPEGMQFEFDPKDPGIARAREIAHARGVDQETFSDMLGVYAANKIAETQTLRAAHDGELAKLGSAGPQRVAAIETWLNARVGEKAAVLVNQMKQYPVAAMIESFESIINQFSHQGGTTFDQRGRVAAQDQGNIPGYENMSFIQRRAAQMQPQLEKAARGGR